MQIAKGGNMIKKLTRFTLFIILLATISLALLWYFQQQKYFPSTDNAYVQANTVHLTPRVTGIVKEVHANNFDHVAKDQLLFTLDPQPFQIAVDKAQANLDNTIEEVAAANSEVSAARSLIEQRKAKLTKIKKDAARTMTLVTSHVYPTAKADEAVSNLQVASSNLATARSQLNEALEKRGATGAANARIRAAKAQLVQAQLNLLYTHVKAPSSGNLVNFKLRPGTEVHGYQPAGTVVENNAWWVTANFKETQLARMQVGEPVTIKLDMYPDHVFKGIVKDISRGSGESFALLPTENATGNWVKVTQRFPVKIAILDQDPRYPLRMGASASVKVDTTHSKKVKLIPLEILSDSGSRRIHREAVSQ